MFDSSRGHILSGITGAHQSAPTLAILQFLPGKAEYFREILFALRFAGPGFAAIRGSGVCVASIGTRPQFLACVTLWRFVKEEVGVWC
jgi:hypothetical protein